MTVRLVGLMSAVLVVSLAAFGLLMNHYQDQVMGELTRTVSAVGRAALNTFVLDAPGDGVQIERRVEEGSESGPPAETGGTGLLHERRVMVVAGEPTHEEEVVVEHLDPSRAEGQGYRWTYRVEVDGVRAEEDPSHGILLRVPALPAGGVEQDILLPIPTADYEDIFSQFQRRSLFLFLGVMVLGTFTSAAVASRFTRPIRRLDRGIRRIADGDLEATVEVHGRDEVARLGRTFNDMVRRLRAARERHRELTRREKLSSLGRLAAGVAHDVRNPLHSIGLTLQHLQETCRPESLEKAAEFERGIEIIRDEIRRLDGLVGNFLRFARTDGRERQRTDLGGLLRETASLVAKEAEWRDVEVVVEIEDPLPPVDVEVESVRASVLNLVLNGFEAMPEGGKITLSAIGRGDEVEISVSDTGVGIPEEDRERVFDFDYTTRDGGNGMGLAMVHQCIVEEHGGRVTLDSRYGDGTRVRLSFPAADARE